MKILGFVLIFISLFAGCTSKQVKDAPPATPPQKTTITPPLEQTEEIIDVISLQKYLRMDYPKEKLGYFEKKFNTCEVGFGYSATQNCRLLYSVTIHYQLKCRQSEGTISTILTDADLTAIESASVRWHLKNLQGLSSTDHLGYGQIRTVSTQSQRRERLRLTIGENFLYLRAGEITKVITPKDWCP